MEWGASEQCGTARQVKGVKGDQHGALLPPGLAARLGGRRCRAAVQLPGPQRLHARRVLLELQLIKQPQQLGAAVSRQAQPAARGAARGVGASAGGTAATGGRAGPCVPAAIAAAARARSMAAAAQQHRQQAARTGSSLGSSQARPAAQQPSSSPQVFQRLLHRRQVQSCLDPHQLLAQPRRRHAFLCGQAREQGAWLGVRGGSEGHIMRSTQALPATATRLAACRRAAPAAHPRRARRRRAWA